MIKALGAGNPSAVADAVGLEPGLRGLAKDLTAALRDLLESAGQAAGDYTTRQIDNKLEFRFDLVNPRAVEWVRENGARLVKDIEQAQRESIRQIVARGIEDGLSPAEQARLIRERVGLLPQQEQSLAEYEDELRAAGVDDDKVEGKLSRRLDEMLSNRATVIARQETIVAAYQGARESWRQMTEDGLLGDEAEQEWVTATDDRLCEDCEPLDGRTAKLDEEFAPGIYQPGDPHPLCRCGLVMRPNSKPADEARRPKAGDADGEEEE